MNLTIPQDFTDAQVGMADNVVDTDAYDGVEWAASGGTYAAGTKLRRTPQGGVAPLVTSGRSYIAAVATTSADGPPENLLAGSTPKYVKAGYTNHYRSLRHDQNNQSERLSPMVRQLTVVGRVTFLDIFKLRADAVRVQTASGYDETIVTRRRKSPVTTWTQWLTTPFVRASGLLLLDLPPVTNDTITITATRSDGGLVGMGPIVLGMPVYMGEAQAGGQSSGQDYSNTERIFDGSFSGLVPRRFVPRKDLTTIYPAEEADSIRSTLEEDCPGTVVAVSGSDVIDHPYFSSLNLLGIVKNFTLRFDESNIGYANFNLEAL